MSTAIPTPQHAGDRRLVGDVPEQAIGLALTRLETANRLVVVITPDSQTANRIYHEYLALMPEAHASLFPDWETLPYDYFSPHQDIISDRLKLLNQLTHGQNGVVFVAVNTLMQRIASPDFIAGHVFQLNLHDQWDIKQQRRRLTEAGYRHVDQVMHRGEFAIRGGIVDIFPMGAKSPFRLELFDDEIDSIRPFDVDSQRSADSIDSIEILPAHEFLLNAATCEQFANRWHEAFGQLNTNSPILEAVQQHHTASGIEYYLPLFFEQTANFLDHIPQSSLLLSYQDVLQAAQQHWQYIEERFYDRHVDHTHPCLPTDELFFRPEALQQYYKRFPLCQLSSSKLAKTGVGRHNWQPRALPDIHRRSQANQPWQHLLDFLEHNTVKPVVFFADSKGRRELLQEHLTKLALPYKTISSWQQLPATTAQQFDYYLTVAPLDKGGIYPELNATAITENDLFTHKVPQRASQSTNANLQEATGVRDLSELKIASPVVHLEHGVGLYVGLTKLNMGGGDNEFLTVEYSDNDKLYIPIHSLHLLSRYSSADVENPPINKLGTDKWSKTKERCTKRIRDVAAELLDINAKRAAQKGFNHNFDHELYQQFAEQFPFVETPDQQQAIDAVMADLQAQQPMDRLLCGDVGFGKTEVAMRAAFIAVNSGCQVAMLVPTTLLAQQHFDSFADRFADWPVNIALLSRFQSASESKQTLAKLAAGSIDIVIGTHKLLNRSLKFNNLGLTIIDEEHRFGVRDKERLKAIRAQVDVLSMTATPIPRTLNMALSTLRELSVIATPPAKRLAIKTFVQEKKNHLLKEAILREVLRGGQVYYLHNEVQTMEHQAQQLQQLLPEIRFATAHGQMRERELEQKMADFYHNRFQVLICSTIVESGIDIPNANTIIIDRADKLGLAQLHQLRGRVGRSHHQAYAYLLTPPWKSLTKNAQKRLQAISEATDLGAGFQLANNDLEIRGAGELLGDEQSGNIQSLGFDLYLEFLERAVKAMKNGQDVASAFQPTAECEVELRISTILPEDYMPDVHNRLQFYQRINQAITTDALDDIKVELIDRFGSIPEPTQNLLRCNWLRIHCHRLGITRLEAHSQGGKIYFGDKTTIDPAKLVNLVQVRPKDFQLVGANQLQFKGELKQTADRIVCAEQTIQRLEGLTT